MPAPVVDKSGVRVQSAYVAPATYAVRDGDSLYSIAFRYRLDWRDVARWNDLSEPYEIFPGQSLRLRQPILAMNRNELSPTNQGRSTVSGIETAPLVPRSTGMAKEVGASESISQPRRQSPWIESQSESQAQERRSVEGVSWQWPLLGPVTRPFDPKATRRGLGISGKAGSSVLAAGEGEVVYSGTALIGYGELIIIKHSDQLLSAYGYNQKRLVKEGDRVRAGAPIAEVGQTPQGEWMLHFEIRRDGQSVDPRIFLPTRN